MFQNEPFTDFANEENAHRVQWAIEATGLNVEVSQAPGSTKGEMLYYLRSPLYPDYASALSAALPDSVSPYERRARPLTISSLTGRT